MDSDTEPIKLKQKKPRSEAQIQALQKAREKAADMRESRNVIREKHGITDETDATPEETETDDTDEPKPDPKAAVIEKKPRVVKPRVVKPRVVKPKPEPKPKEPEPEPEPEPEEVKQYRREVQEAPPPPKQHFRMIRSMNKSYMLYDE